METYRPDQSMDEPNSKRPKLETDASTSSKSQSVNNCPILNLPPDILAKIIVKIPVAQWSSLESLDPNFRDASWIAWRQLREINVKRELLIKPKMDDDDSSFPDTLAPVNSMLQKLDERSPFLTSLSGLELHMVYTQSNSDVISSLARFEHLQSITLGDRRGGIPLEAVVEFLESTRSRTSLKELHLINIDQLDDHDTIIERFASSLMNGREIQSPLKLEKFTFSSPNHSLRIGLDTLDTTRLTDIRVAKASIEPEQLTNLIERASGLLRIELAFLPCPRDGDVGCTRQRLQSNKNLLLALASHEHLMSVKLDCRDANDYCKCTFVHPDLIEMFKTIGRRGQIRKLALEKRFVLSFYIVMDDICTTICDCMPYLQSIKLYFDDQVVDGNVSDIIGLAELEDVHLTTSEDFATTTSAFEKLFSLSHLKRLALHAIDDNAVLDSLNVLDPVSTLTDLRIKNAFYEYDAIFENWSELIASNLQILMLHRFGNANGGDNTDEDGLVLLLQNAIQLRVLILQGGVTDRSLIAIASSCPQLEILGIDSSSNEGITVQRLQEVVDRCPKLKRLGGIGNEMRGELQFPKYRKISDVDMKFWKYDFDADEYD